MMFSNGNPKVSDLCVPLNIAATTSGLEKLIYALFVTLKTTNIKMHWMKTMQQTVPTNVPVLIPMCFINMSQNAE